MEKSNEEKAREIAEKIADEVLRTFIREHFTTSSLCDSGILEKVLFIDESALASAEKKAYEKGREEGIKYKCQLIAECKEQWIDECEKVARSHLAIGGGCPLSDESVRSYNEAVKQIAESINKLKRG